MKKKKAVVKKANVMPRHAPLEAGKPPERLLPPKKKEPEPVKHPKSKAAPEPGQVVTSPGNPPTPK